MMTLLQHRNTWYRSNQIWSTGKMMLQYFDTVINVEDDNDHFTIVKNRFNITGDGQFGDLFRMQLFASGMSIQDLPLVTVRPSIGGAMVMVDDNTEQMTFL